MNFFQYQCYLHAWIPRVDLGNGKIRQVQAPWEGHAPGFTLLFEALILELVKVMPVHNVCQLLNVYDNKLWKMIKVINEAVDKVRKADVMNNPILKGSRYIFLFKNQSSLCYPLKAKKNLKIAIDFFMVP